MIEDAPERRPGRGVPQRLKRGAYILPSLFTIGNMLLGFYAVVCGLRGDFRTAALMVFAAAIVDTFDGLIARLTGTESDFGKEYDSLADVITFGAVPALLTYLWGLADFHRDAWLLSLFFMVCTATRLARFNVQHKVVDKRWFVGLPTPAAAGTICSMLFWAPDAEWRPWLQGLVAVSLLVVGLLMVSTFRYRSVKGLDARQRMSYRVAVPIAAILLVLKYATYAFFLTFAVLYALSGPAVWLWGRLRRGDPGRPDLPEETPGEILSPLPPMPQPPSPPDDIPYRR